MNSSVDRKLCPLRFDPIYQYRLWGGRRLEEILGKPLPGNDPIGEAWVFSDRDDFTNTVIDGPFKGQTLTQLMQKFKPEIMGRFVDEYPRFPLLLKFLDCQEMLSVQVHPSDSQTDLLPPGERGKTEAWLVLEADSKGRIYEGLNPGTTPETLRAAVADKTIGDFLPYFTPKAGDGVFMPAGTVHTLGGGVVVFEVQENSDVTFRLYDWDRVDAKTGKPRELHIEKSLASIDFEQGIGAPITPVVETKEPVLKEQMFECGHFQLWRLIGDRSFTVGAKDEPRILVCIEGAGTIEYEGSDYDLEQGDVMLLPASVGVCICEPTSPVTLLEIGLPNSL